MILATLRIPAGNLLAMFREVKFNFYLSIIVGIINIGLNFLLIPRYGSIGATYAYITVVILSSLILIPYLLFTLKQIKQKYIFNKTKLENENLMKEIEELKKKNMELIGKN